MKIKYLSLLFYTGLMLSGCNKQTPTTNCSSPDTQKLLDKLVTEQAVKLTTEKRYDQYDGSFVFGATKIRASLAQIQIAIENIKMVKQDSNNSQILCSGLLKATIPVSMLSDAEQARDIQHQLKIAQYARQLNIENSNNVFTQNVEYTVTPASNDKDPAIQFESTAWANLLDEITTAVLLKPTLDTSETYYVQKNESVKPAADALKPKVDKINVEARKLETTQEKQGLDRLNKELLDMELTEKELAKKQVSGQPPTQSALPDTKPFSPSFNCKNTTKLTEITICSTPELAAFDVKNMLLYKTAKAMNPVATNTIWKESIKSKYACGTDINCIAKVYQKSIYHYDCIATKDKENCETDAQ